jgi:hypothetical protein
VRGTSRRPRCRPIRIQKRLANDGGGAARANQTAASRMLAGGNLVRRVSRAQSEERHSARSDWEGSLPAATLSRQMRPFSLLWSMLIIIAHESPSQTQRLSFEAYTRCQGWSGRAGQGRLARQGQDRVRQLLLFTLHRLQMAALEWRLAVLPNLQRVSLA